MNSAAHRFMKFAKFRILLQRSIKPILSTTRSLITISRYQKCLSFSLVKPKQFACNPNGVRYLSSTSDFEVLNIQDEEDFKTRVLDASCKTPVIVDFHATWCGPCKILGPRLESIVSKAEGEVIMAKVDIDDHNEIAMEYGVRSVPTVMAVKNGKVESQFVGALDEDQIQTFVDKLTVS